MKELMNSVTSLIDEEYARASGVYGPLHNSDHEAYAVMLEEFQEADAERFDCECSLDKLWEQIKMDSSDYNKEGVLRRIECYAKLAACEFIQVAAMAKKAILTIERRQRK